jgi:hypothetical protein
MIANISLEQYETPRIRFADKITLVRGQLGAGKAGNESARRHFGPLTPRLR